MTLRKWDYERHEYLPHKVPETWNVVLYCSDMKRLVNCANCGAEHKFGKGYTSQEIHNGLGMGYSVCPKCHKAEMERYLRKKAKT